MLNIERAKRTKKASPFSFPSFFRLICFLKLELVLIYSGIYKFCVFNFVCSFILPFGIIKNSTRWFFFFNDTIYHEIIATNHRNLKVYAGMFRIFSYF